MPITGDDLITQLTSGKYLVLGNFIVSLSNITDKSYDIANVIAGADGLKGHICETFNQAVALQVNIISSNGLPETPAYTSDQWKVLFERLVKRIHPGTLDGPMEPPGNDNDSGGASHLVLRF